MTLLNFTMIVSLLAGVYGETKECSDIIAVECTNRYDLTSPLQNTTEDYEVYCFNIIAHIRCKEGVVEKCVQENIPINEEDLERNEEHVRIVESELCNNDFPDELFPDFYEKPIECFDLVFKECPYKYGSTRPLLNTTEDYRDYCSYAISHLRCRERVFEKCVQENIPVNEEYLELNKVDIRTFESTVCNEDSQVFRDIANNVNCYYGWIPDAVCYFGYFDEDKLFSLFNENFDCINEIWMHYCFKAQVGVKCGNYIGNTVGFVLKSQLLPHCKPTLRSLLYLEAAFKFEFCQGKHGKEAVLPGIIDTISKQTEYQLSTVDETY